VTLLEVLEIISNILIGVGMFFIIFGTIGIFRFKEFYSRILVTTKVDTVGMLTLLVGLAVREPLSFFTGKMLLMAIIVLILNPLTAHVMVRSAYASGYEIPCHVSKNNTCVKEEEAEEEADLTKPIF